MSTVLNNETPSQSVETLGLHKIYDNIKKQRESDNQWQHHRACGEID